MLIYFYYHCLLYFCGCMLISDCFIFSWAPFPWRGHREAAGASACCMWLKAGSTTESLAHRTVLPGDLVPWQCSEGVLAPLLSMQIHRMKWLHTVPIFSTPTSLQEDLVVLCLLILLTVVILWSSTLIINYTMQQTNVLHTHWSTSSHTHPNPNNISYSLILCRKLQLSPKHAFQQAIVNYVKCKRFFFLRVLPTFQVNYAYMGPHCCGNTFSFEAIISPFLLEELQAFQGWIRNVIPWECPGPAIGPPGWTPHKADEKDVSEQNPQKTLIFYNVI